MLMLVSAQEQLMPITTLSALTTLQSTATTFIIKKVATVRSGLGGGGSGRGDGGHA
jgi:hypothetical protein